MTLTQASMGVQDQSTKYVASVTYKGTAATSGDIIVTTRSDAGLPPGASGKTVVLRGEAKTDTGQVLWKCGGGTSPVEAKYLPSSCKDF
jgi:type IV pilus assembly protein PilA